jgi:hypothetical protein
MHFKYCRDAHIRGTVGNTKYRFTRPRIKLQAIWMQIKYLPIPLQVLLLQNSGSIKCIVTNFAENSLRTI